MDITNEIVSNLKPLSIQWICYMPKENHVETLYMKI